VSDVADRRRNRCSSLPNQFKVLYHATPQDYEYVTLRSIGRRVTSARVEFFSFCGFFRDLVCTVPT
jgi:hypothetical protein